ncbi:MAG: phenylalanine--tRNA ligase subunit beta [Clostridia bacterium]|nr:phenylalanine--tRNA ligase subunit beta [Clostridia bacterium]
MYISLNWIKEYVDLEGIPTSELTRRFGLSTAEIEGVEEKGTEIENVVVAEILTCEKHPNSDHLHILTVNDGSGSPVQVVCGAPNVRVGLKTYFARCGGSVPGMKIKPCKLAGVDSFGMCCGGHELGIESDESGIVELDDSYPIGKDIAEILPIRDTIIEVDNKSLTNRPDLWGHYGIAREFATIFKKDLKPIEKEDLTKYNNLPALNIKVETKNCYRYCGLTVKNVINKTSPAIVKLRLNYCGMRDINLLADMTNYLMLELGQPMHAFDNNIVKGITVIETDKPIEMETLEGENHTIETESMVICDENRSPVAVAGIKGGLKSGISDSTDSLLLESACFDCVAIRKTSRKIGLITDASQRYEKSLDPELCPIAIERLVYLLRQAEPRIEVTSSLSDVYNFHYPKHVIEIDLDFLSRRGGVELKLDFVLETLIRLGFKVDVLDYNNGKLIVYVPSFRGTKDISIKEDLVEEIFRIYGYDNISSASMKMPLNSIDQIPTHTLEYEIKYSLASLFGLNEVHSYIWNQADYNKSVGIEETSILHLMDSSNAGQSGIRSHLAPSIIKFADENKNKFSNIGIFEIGHVVDALDENNLAVEKKKLSIVLGSETKSEKELYFNLKSMVEFIVKNIVHSQVEYSGKTESNIYHPINSCSISSGEILVGEMGILHPVITKNIDKRKKFAVLEIDIEKLLELSKIKFKVVPTSKFQPVSVDYNFVADKNLAYGEIEKNLIKFQSKLLSRTYPQRYLYQRRKFARKNQLYNQLCYHSKR